MNEKKLGDVFIRQFRNAGYTVEVKDEEAKMTRGNDTITVSKRYINVLKKALNLTNNKKEN